MDHARDAKAWRQRTPQRVSCLPTPCGASDSDPSPTSLRAVASYGGLGGVHLRMYLHTRFGPRCSPTLVTSTPSVKSAAYPRCQSCACQMAKAQARPTPCLRRLPTHPTESLAQKREQDTDVRPPQGVPPSSAVRARERHLRS